jgi:hypothetical protein
VVGDACDPRVQVPAAQRLGDGDHALVPGQLVPRELRRPVPMSLREQRVQQDGYAPVGRQPVRDVRPDEPGAGDQDPRMRRRPTEPTISS